MRRAQIAKSESMPTGSTGPLGSVGSPCCRHRAVSPDLSLTVVVAISILSSGRGAMTEHSYPRDTRRHSPRGTTAAVDINVLSFVARARRFAAHLALSQGQFKDNDASEPVHSTG
jgi:hypothetical protein